MIPLRDVIPSRTTPYITITIIVLNALAWLFELALPRDALPVFLQRLRRRARRTSPRRRSITSMFLHGSWSHVIGNMWYLWIFGDNVEDRVGHGRFIVFYLLCGIAAALGQIVDRSDVDAADDRRERRDRRRDGRVLRALSALARADADSADLLLEIVELPAIVLLGFWFLMQLFSAGAIAVTANTGGGGVAFMAHVAGFVIGHGRGVRVQEAAARPVVRRIERGQIASTRSCRVGLRERRMLRPGPMIWSRSERRGGRSRRRIFSSSASYWSGGDDSFRAFSSSSCVSSSARRRSRAARCRPAAPRTSGRLEIGDARPAPSGPGLCASRPTPRRCRRVAAARSAAVRFCSNHCPARRRSRR